MRFAGSGPAAARPANPLDDQPARLCMEFDFFGQIRFVEERLGDPDPPRIADSDDARLRGHCDYSVATSGRSLQVPASATQERSRHQNLSITRLRRRVATAE